MVEDHILRNSFTKAKEHINKLENDILSQNKEILELNRKLELILTDNKDLKEKLNDLIISIGNNGVKQINKQINKQMIKQLSTPLNTNLIKNLIEEQFKTITKQELKTFLTIYQIEEEKGQVSYEDLSISMGITTSCIRVYVANLLKRGLPINKIKVKNKNVILLIKEDFRALNIKQKLISLYYESDPNQTKLLDI